MKKGQKMTQAEKDARKIKMELNKKAKEAQMIRKSDPNDTITELKDSELPMYDLARKYGKVLIITDKTLFSASFMNLAHVAARDRDIAHVTHAWDTSIHYEGIYKVRWICKAKYAKAKNINDDYNKILGL